MSRRCAPRWAGVFVGLLLVAYPTVLVGATIGLNFPGANLDDGIFATGKGYAPPDNGGGVGPDHVVQLINGAFVVFNKTNGTPLQFMSGQQFWSNAGVDPGTGPGTTNLGAFNQRVLYDPTSGRWIAAALTGASENNHVLLARSETSNPAGDWQAVSFLGNNETSGKFADFTRLGVDANGVYIATDNFASLAGGLEYQSVFSVPKADLMASTPIMDNMQAFFGLNQDVNFVGSNLQPIVNFGPVGSHAPLLGTGVEANETFLYRSDLMNTAMAGATLSLDGTPIEVNSYVGPPAAAQPDQSHAIGLLDYRFKGHVYQVGNVIYAAHDVKIGSNAAIKWYKIDEMTNEVIEEGILSDPNYDYFQGSIAANANGDVVIGFNRSGTGPDGQIRIYAVHGTTVGDVTTFGAPILLKASTVDAYHYINTRWGDYTTTVVDPLDPNVFWTFQEYALTNNDWATQITQIIVPEPSSVALAVIALVAFAAAA
ncbi:MAG: hypothetical protein WDZ48_07955, partial [Pirellulales bacterium]